MTTEKQPLTDYQKKLLEARKKAYQAYEDHVAEQKVKKSSSKKVEK